MSDGRCPKCGHPTKGAVRRTDEARVPLCPPCAISFYGQAPVGGVRATPT